MHLSLKKPSPRPELTQRKRLFGPNDTKHHQMFSIGSSGNPGGTVALLHNDVLMEEHNSNYPSPKQNLTTALLPKFSSLLLVSIFNGNMSCSEVQMQLLYLIAYAPYQAQNS